MEKEELQKKLEECKQFNQQANAQLLDLKQKVEFLNQRMFVVEGKAQIYAAMIAEIEAKEAKQPPAEQKV